MYALFVRTLHCYVTRKRHINPFHTSGDLLSAEYFSRQFGPRSGSNVSPGLNPNCLTVIVF